MDSDWIPENQHKRKRSGTSSSDESSDDDDDGPPNAVKIKNVDSLRDPLSGLPVIRSHPEKLMGSLDYLRQHQEFCDVVLVVGDRRFHAHRVVLAGSSDYFKAMFLGNVREKNEKEVTLVDVDPVAFGAIMDFLYVGKIRFTTDTVEKLLSAANLTQILEVKELCCEHLQNHLRASSVLGIQKLADLYACEKLLKVAEKYLKTHCLVVMKTKEFLQLSVDEMIDFLLLDCVNRYSKEFMVQAVLAWLEFGAEIAQPRIEYVGKIMEALQLRLLEQNFYLVNGKARNPEELCVLEYLLKVSVPQLQADVETPAGNSVKAAAARDEVLFAVESSPSNLRYREQHIRQYNPKTLEWKEITFLPQKADWCSVVVHDGWFYVLGGRDMLKTSGEKYLRSVSRYSPQRNHWSEDISVMNSSRQCCAVAVVSGFLYAAGGIGHDAMPDLLEGPYYVHEDEQDGSSSDDNSSSSSYESDSVYEPPEPNSLSSVERCDLSTNKWTYLEPMTKQRTDFTAVVLEDRLYVCGGSASSSLSQAGVCDRDLCLDSVERYEHYVDKWTTMKPMINRRCSFGATVFDGKLYVFGGRHMDDLCMTACERFDPQLNSWESIASLNCGRRRCGVAVIDGLIYVAGGIDGPNLCFTEVYNPKTNLWTFCYNFGGYSQDSIGPSPWEIVFGTIPRNLVGAGKLEAF